jgi:hypothetical protein
VIFELERGKVTGSGTYDGLLGNSEAFRRLAYAGEAGVGNVHVR